jgi:hypothetical protein
MAEKELREARKKRCMDYRGKQAMLRDRYGIRITGALRVHIEKSVHPSGTRQRATRGLTQMMSMAPPGQWEQLILRPLATLPDRDDITHAAFPNHDMKAICDSE